MLLRYMAEKTVGYDNRGRLRPPRSVECVDSFRRLLGAIRPNESWVYLDASEPTVSGQDAGLAGAGLLAWARLGV